MIAPNLDHTRKCGKWNVCNFICYLFGFYTQSENINLLSVGRCDRHLVIGQTLIENAKHTQTSNWHAQIKFLMQYEHRFNCWYNFYCISDSVGYISGYWNWRTLPTPVWIRQMIFRSCLLLFFYPRTIVYLHGTNNKSFDYTNIISHRLNMFVCNPSKSVRMNL